MIYISFGSRDLVEIIQNKIAIISIDFIVSSIGNW